MKKVIDTEITYLDNKTNRKKRPNWRDRIEPYDIVVPMIIAAIIVTGPYGLAILFMLWCLKREV